MQQDIVNSILWWLKKQTCIGLVVIALSFLSGCATDGKVKPALDMHAPSLDKGPTVERLIDGREGFIILEVPQMDEASRRDFDRAVAMLNDQEYDQAIGLLEKIIEQSPGVTAPYIDIAIAYQHIGRLDQAEAHLKTALQLVPDHPVACNVYGLLYRKTGRFAEARMMYEKTLSSFPDYYPAYRNLGILCDLYLDDLVCALENYEIYSWASPEDKQVQSWIADLRARINAMKEQ